MLLLIERYRLMSGGVSMPQDVLIAQSGLPLLVLQKQGAALKAAGLIEKATDGGIQFGPTLNMERALAIIPKRRVGGANALPWGFVRLWELYPNPGARTEALAEYRKINPPDEEVERMIRMLAQHVLAWQAEGRTRDKVPQLRRWLHNRHWDDEVKVGSIGQGATPMAIANAAALEEAARRRGL